MPIGRTLWNRRIPMRDGIHVAADVILPEGEGPFPAVIERTPYSRGRLHHPTSWVRLVERGYAFVAVDLRGRGDSEGEFEPFKADGYDGYDTVEWIAAQPWCTGRTGMVGISYDGLTQWWTARHKPPHLSCIAPMACGAIETGPVPGYGGTGMPLQYWFWWMHFVTGRTAQHTSAVAWSPGWTHLPLRTFDEHLGTGHPWWQQYVRGEWELGDADCSLTAQELADFDTPTLVCVGWWDEQTTIPTFVALSDSKGAANVHLLVGAWDHAGNNVVRPVLGGLDVSAGMIDIFGAVEEFLAIHLKPGEAPAEQLPRCRVFRTGAMEWDDLEDWPDRSAQPYELYLRSGGSAQSSSGDGRLSTGSPPAGEYDNNRSPRVQGGSTPIPAKADDYRALADNGYVVAAVDVRGRGDSEGEFVPFVHEAADGADVIRWVRALEECNGRVGVFGSGYAGFAGLAAAAGGGVDAVSAVSPFGPGTAGLIAPGGAVRLEWLFWMHVAGGRTVQSLHAPRWRDVFDHLPIATMHEALGREDVWWSDWLAHLDPEDELWSPFRDVYWRLGSLSVPMLLFTGWWDTSQPATFAYWESAAVAAGGGGELVVGPWDTAATRSPTRHVGGVDFGPEASVDLTDLLLDWFDRHLGPDPASVAVSRARLFVTGADRWASLTAWPPEGEGRSLWLSSDGRANTRAGDGWLHEVPGGGKHPDAFTYDPARPVLWQPGFTSFSRESSALTLDESHLTTRDDVLVYTTEPAGKQWTVAGTCRLVLFAETDAPDTDWIATLSDVFPYDGNAVHLTHAAVRAGSCPDFTPGTVTKFTLTFADIAHEFQPGHALRLTVTSSLFPLYARNSNDRDYLGAAETRIARQRIHHDADHPSCLQVPVVGSPLVLPRGARTDWFA